MWVCMWCRQQMGDESRCSTGNTCVAEIHALVLLNNKYNFRQAGTIDRELTTNPELNHSFAGFASCTAIALSQSRQATLSRVDHRASHLCILSSLERSSADCFRRVSNQGKRGTKRIKGTVPMPFLNPDCITVVTSPQGCTTAYLLCALTTLINSAI